MRERWPYIVVVMTVAINSLGIGLILPVMPSLLLEMGLPDLSDAAAIGGMLSLVFAAMQFLFAPLLGRLSDRYGRRVVLITSLVAVGIDYLLLAVASSLWLFFVARIVSGVGSATFSVANAILADLSPPEKRAATFGLTGAAFGVGFVLGPVIGGFLGEFGPRAPFLAAAALALLNAGLAYLTLPETLKPENRRALDLRSINPFAAFAELARRPALGRLIFVAFFDALSGLVYPAVWAYFAIAQFGWSTATVGLSLASYGACFALIQAGLIRVILRHLGEMRTAVLGLSAGIIGFVILTQLSSGLWAFILSPLWALRSVTGTALNGLLSRKVGEDEQGMLQGMVTGLSGLTTMIGIPVMTLIFASATRDTAAPFNGAPFAAAATLAGAALLVLLAPNLLAQSPRNTTPPKRST